MAYIYVITNQINGKQYVGKTLNTIETRFKEHCSDSKKERCNKRPLYDAMNKYGIENFTIETLEECSNDIVNDREIYWIDKLNTYHNGYNATLGGDGKAYIDAQQILTLWQKGYIEKEIATSMQVDGQTVKKYLCSFGISPSEIIERGRSKCRIAIAQIDKNTNEVIQVFNSTREAHRALNKPIASHITDVLKGRRKSAYGYVWKYLTDI